MANWQPIETPPIGIDILCYGMDIGLLVVSREDKADLPFIWATLDGPYYKREAFTHWMLPTHF